MIVLGVDPGTAITGWGLIESLQCSSFKVHDFGVITTKSSEPFHNRLYFIHKELKKVIHTYQPSEVAIEELFFAKNVKTAIQVGQARGVVILTAAESDLKIFEYTPLEVKQAIVGYGRAEKMQMQKMIKTLLRLDCIPKPDDAADALSIAFTHISCSRTQR